MRKTARSILGGCSAEKQAPSVSVDSGKAETTKSSHKKSDYETKHFKKFEHVINVDPETLTRIS